MFVFIKRQFEHGFFLPFKHNTMAERVTTSGEENEELIYLEKIMSGKMDNEDDRNNKVLDEEIGYVTAPIGKSNLSEIMYLRYATIIVRQINLFFFMCHPFLKFHCCC